jgi:hypothetical protein
MARVKSPGPGTAGVYFDAIKWNRVSFNSSCEGQAIGVQRKQCPGW